VHIAQPEFAKKRCAMGNVFSENDYAFHENVVFLPQKKTLPKERFAWR
jgi:hypothetical protein